MGRPETNEAAAYYFTYIERVGDGEIVGVMERQLDEVTRVCRGVSEGKSLHRYAPEKWSVREVLNHISDTERAFAFRALWFGRGFTEPLASFDQNVGVTGARANDFSWASHIEDFDSVRRSTLNLFRNMPGDGWKRSGVASGNHVTVNALAYIIAGHCAHHLAILSERYL
jgi:hypothetical protein